MRVDEIERGGKQQQCLLWMAIGRSVGTAAVATNVPPTGHHQHQSKQCTRALEQQGSRAAG